MFFIGFFFLTPFIVDFSKKYFSKNVIVTNNSNINFNRVLEGKEIKENGELIENDEVNFKNLFTDVFEFDINIGDNSSDFIDIMHTQEKLDKSINFLNTSGFNFSESIINLVIF